MVTGHNRNDAAVVTALARGWLLSLFGFHLELCRDPSPWQAARISFKTTNVTIRRSAVFHILKSGPVRIAAVFAIAVIVVTTGVFTFVYWKVSIAQIAQVRTVLESEAAKAAHIPEAGMKDQLALRLTHDLRRIDYVGLFNSAGQVEYGNVEDVPVPSDGAAHLIDFSPRSASAAQTSIFVAIRLQSGSILVLGRSLLEVYHIEEAVRLAFFMAIIPITIMALITGIAVGYRANQRLRSIQSAIRRVMKGELSVRLPERASSDDISALVGAVNSMLDEIVRLVNQIKSVGDNIAHDLKTPLALVRARLERGCKSNSFDVLQRCAEDALLDLDNALAIISALLRISELESGLRRAAFKQVNVAEICRDIFDMFEPVAAEKNIAMHLEALPSRIIFGDDDLIREALANLIDNAIKFTPPGGAITVQCHQGDEMIRVCDTGPGISDADRGKIFDRFYRSGQAVGTPGFGLGLNMAATIAELHGGHLRAAANAPGAVFEWIMPGTATSGSVSDNHVPDETGHI